MLEIVLDKIFTADFPLRRLSRSLLLAGRCWRERSRQICGPEGAATTKLWGTMLRATMLLLAVLSMATLSGCSHLRPKLASQYVYVTAKQTFLRDRVAAVSNRTGTVENGQKLEVMETGKRFYRIKTEKGEIGWIDEKAVATQEVFDAFKALAETHKGDPSVASAVVQDEVNLHLKPGRDTERFYRLAEGEKLQMLVRATLPKPVPGGAVPTKIAKPGIGSAATSGSNSATAGNAADDQAAAVPPPIAMEDWWLVRDAKGRAGWVLSRMLEVDAPDSLTRYSEGQRIVGAYILATVHDDEAPQDVKDIPIYVTVLSPYLAGLPYDFDQVRVFTWNLKMHRYETAYREKNIEGYLPLTIKMSRDPFGKAATALTPLPTFTYKVLAGDAGAVIPDPTTGTVTPGRTIEKTFRLEGNIVRRLQAAGSPPDNEAHPVVEVKKDKKGKKK
jgi:SH3-like domain-containing protein